MRPMLIGETTEDLPLGARPSRFIGRGVLRARHPVAARRIGSGSNRPTQSTDRAAEGRAPSAPDYLRSGTRAIDSYIKLLRSKL